MKTIKNASKGIWKRVSDKEADSTVGSTWKYAPKSEWKTNVRDLNKPSKEDSAPKEKKKKEKTGEE